MLSVWLITGFCNHSNNPDCLSGFPREEFEWEKFFFVILLKPYFKVHRPKKGKETSIICFYCEADGKFKLEPCHSFRWVLLLLQKEMFENSGHMSVGFREEKKKKKTETWVQPCNCCNILLEGKFGSYQWWWIHVVFPGTGLANRLIPTVKLLKPMGSGTSTCFCTRHILFHRSHQERINYLKGPLPRHSWIVSFCWTL